MGSFRFVAFGRIFIFGRSGAFQRQDGHGFGMGFVDVFFHRFFHLRGQILGVARVPDGVAGGRDRGGQLSQQSHHVRAFVENVLAADGFDLAMLALADGHA